jgi:hypothetical protein
MSEWLRVFVLIAFVWVIFGLIYALRLYKQMEADSDREWAKRRGMRELSHSTARCRCGPIRSSGVRVFEGAALGFFLVQ